MTSGSSVTVSCLALSGDCTGNSETSDTLFPLCVCVPNAMTHRKQGLTIFVKGTRYVVCEVRITCMYEVLTNLIQVVTLTRIGVVVMAVVPYCGFALLIGAVCLRACVRARFKLYEPCVLYIGRAYRYPPDFEFYIFFSTNISTEYFKHVAHSPFLSSKCRLFHNANFFGSCIIHILHTGCAKIEM
jgi:hypothetical protein